MRYLGAFIFLTLVTLLKCSDGASISEPESSKLQSGQFSLPWDNLFSFISYFATSSPPSYDPSSNENSCEDQSCGQESTGDSSETIIIYDVEQQVLPQDAKNNTTNSTDLNVAQSSRLKRNAEESKQLSGSSEGRHKEVRPYPGYFLGRKLWYVPLWFTVYYTFYLLCLVVKSVARHRIRYPALLPADQSLERKRLRQKKKLDTVTNRVADSIRVNSARYGQYY